MPEMIKSQTWREAWLAGANHLLGLPMPSDLNLVLVMAEPLKQDTNARTFDQLLDEFLKANDCHPLHTIAETIFPGWQYRRRGLRGLFEVYSDEEYPRLKSDRPTSWGTYAHRLISRKDSQGKVTNPLKNLIDKINMEKTTAGPKKACYEVGVAEGEYDAPLYNTVEDDHRHMGGPCLSHVSFKLYNGAVHLTAFYRSHDYRSKAHGNLLGLARLLACVAQETQLPVGSLTVHSSYAWFSPGGLKAFRQLVREASDLLDDKGEPNGMAV